MAHRFPSKEWTSAYADAVNANDAYRTAGKDWNHGTVAMVVRADASIGIEDDTAMILDVEGGTCRGTKYLTGMPAVEEENPAFIIVASYPRWKEVINGEIDPIKAMMQGKLKLTKGHLPTMLRFVESSRQLVASAQKVSTEFVA